MRRTAIAAAVAAAIASAVAAGPGSAEDRQSEEGAKPNAAAPATGEHITVRGKVNISQENASRVIKSLMSTAPHASHHVPVEVGSPAPGDLELLALPPAVASLVPEYRDYEYVVVEDQIAIVEPSTRRVVEVIRAGGKPATGGAAPPQPD